MRGFGGRKKYCGSFEHKAGSGTALSLFWTWGKRHSVLDGSNGSSTVITHRIGGSEIHRVGRLCRYYYQIHILFLDFKGYFCLLRSWPVY